jgi:hypothetical protein
LVVPPRAFARYILRSSGASFFCAMSRLTYPPRWTVATRTLPSSRNSPALRLKALAVHVRGAMTGTAHQSPFFWRSQVSLGSSPAWSAYRTKSV